MLLVSPDESSRIRAGQLKTLQPNSRRRLAHGADQCAA